MAVEKEHPMLATKLMSALTSGNAIALISILKEFNAESDKALRHIRQLQKEAAAVPTAKPTPAPAPVVAEVKEATSASVVAKGEPTPMKQPAPVEVSSLNPVQQKLVDIGAVAALHLFESGGIGDNTTDPGQIQTLGLDDLDYYLENIPSWVDQFGHTQTLKGLDIFQFWTKKSDRASQLKEHGQPLMFFNEDLDGCDIFVIDKDNYRQVADIRALARTRAAEKQARIDAAGKQTAADAARKKLEATMIAIANGDLE